MSDWNDLVRHTKAKLSTSIIKYPSGRYGLVGSMPIELTRETQNSIGQTIHDSMIWDTEQDTITALLNIGITRFQLSDCTWYKHKGVSK